MTKPSFRERKMSLKQRPPLRIDKVELRAITRHCDEPFIFIPGHGRNTSRKVTAIVVRPNR